MDVAANDVVNDMTTDERWILSTVGLWMVGLHMILVLRTMDAANNDPVDDEAAADAHC